MQRCSHCSLYQYPPDIICVSCQSPELAVTEVSGRGTLYSYATVDRAFHAGFVDRVPYVVGLIELEEQAGLRMLTNIVDTDPKELRVGLPLEVTFEDRAGTVLPQFRSAGAPPVTALTRDVAIVGVGYSPLSASVTRIRGSWLTPPSLRRSPMPG